MSWRVLTSELREQLTPTGRSRLRQALESRPTTGDEETPIHVIDRRTCRGEIPERWVVRLTIRLGDFVCHQLSRQEGFRVAFKSAIVASDRGKTILWWGLPGEVIAMPWRESWPIHGYSISSRAHPPFLELPDIEQYPMEVPYAISAGFLTGRLGILLVQRSGRIDDEVLMMS